MATNAARLPRGSHTRVVPPVTKKIAPFRRIYVWELPVRITHWLNAVAITVLAVTGYLIGNPIAFWQTANVEPSDAYWFGWIRFAHFVSGYLLFFSFLFRFYWGFV